MPQKKIVKVIDPVLGELYLEVEDRNAVATRSGGSGDDGKEKVHDGKMDDVFDNVKKISQVAMQSLSMLKPDEMELKIGVKIDWSNGKLLSWIVDMNTECQFEVTLKWKPNEIKPPVA